jgi:hypothetical protein
LHPQHFRSLSCHAFTQERFRERGISEQELDALVDAARTRHYRRTSTKKRYWETLIGGSSLRIVIDASLRHGKPQKVLVDFGTPRRPHRSPTAADAANRS